MRDTERTVSIVVCDHCADSPLTTMDSILLCPTCECQDLAEILVDTVTNSDRFRS